LFSQRRLVLAAVFAALLRAARGAIPDLDAARDVRVPLAWSLPPLVPVARCVAPFLATLVRVAVFATPRLVDDLPAVTDAAAPPAVRAPRAGTTRRDGFVCTSGVSVAMRVVRVLRDLVAADAVVPARPAFS
jgi:hypothetical protein